jgi:1-acyl-sn-glycerol-3-phosphate acyltransferase
MSSGNVSLKRDVEPPGAAEGEGEGGGEGGGGGKSGAELHGLVLLIYNLIYWPYLFFSCAVLFFPALLIWLFTFWDPRRRLLGAFTSLWGAHYLTWAPFAGVTVEGASRVPRDTPCVYVSNHQSMVDILAVFATRLPFKWVSKVENFYAPFLGWNMLLNRYIALKRGNLPSIRRMLRACNACLRGGDSLFVFPEGTRSPDGELRSFFQGAFRIAVRNRAPIVPMVIEGTNSILPKGQFRIVPRHVLVSILDPVDPASVDYDHRRLQSMVRERMLAEQDRIRGRKPRGASTQGDPTDQA